MQSIVKKDPGMTLQDSLATAGTNFTKPGAHNKGDLCTVEARIMYMSQTNDLKVLWYKETYSLIILSVPNKSYFFIQVRPGRVQARRKMFFKPRNT